MRLIHSIVAKAGCPRTTMLVLCLGLVLPLIAATNWNPEAAARYLDQRQEWWEAWPPAQRDHSTVCVSCHTSLPYALARPALRRVFGERTQAEMERRLIESVKVRVDLWSKVTPYYTDSAGQRKRLQSLGTESVLNALILADAGNGTMSGAARSAFAHMWELQQNNGKEKGSWLWLDFGNEPFEARESVFFGAALAAVAVGMAPQEYQGEPEVRSRVSQLGEYIRREVGAQPLIHQMAALWASTRLPSLLTSAQQKTIVEAVLRSQRPDGGWSTASLCCNWEVSARQSLFKLWIRSDASPLAGKSDGYATGLAAFALGQAGVPPDDIHVRRAQSWLMGSQDQTKGSWPGYSLNTHADSAVENGSFMTDAATAWAVLALTVNGAR